MRQGEKWPRFTSVEELLAVFRDRREQVREIRLLCDPLATGLYIHTAGDEKIGIRPGDLCELGAAGLLCGVRVVLLPPPRWLGAGGAF